MAVKKGTIQILDGLQRSKNGRPFLRFVLTERDSTQITGVAFDEDAFEIDKKFHKQAFWTLAGNLTSEDLVVTKVLQVSVPGKSRAMPDIKESKIEFIIRVLGPEPFRAFLKKRGYDKYHIFLKDKEAREDWNKLVDYLFNKAEEMEAYENNSL